MVVAVAVVQPNIGSAHEEVGDVQQALDAMVAAGTPGVLARMDDAGRSWTATSGVADVERASPVPRAGRFRAASLTKALVSAVLLQLAGSRKVDLDEPVGRWLPGVITHADRITVRQLMNHTAGLADYMAAPEFADPLHYTKQHYAPTQLIAYAEKLGAVSEPGAGFHYSNTGCIVLGLLIERASGRPIQDVLTDRIFRPLGMTQSSFPVRENKIPGPHATGYYVPDGSKPDHLVALTDLDPSFEWAAFGLISSGRDINGSSTPCSPDGWCHRPR
jgi:D-alanyl-D-alanine carboxypeptidase